ncbi:hypothetical protein [Clostridium cavendishii]|nr:hypothetical protein [Clostridium cavendishii]
MNTKIREILNVALIPFKDLFFFEEDTFLKIADPSEKKNKSFLLEELVYKISETSEIKNLDEVYLILNKYYPFLREREINEDKVYECYYENLRKFTTTLISHRNGKIVYKYWKNNLDDEFIGPYEEYKKIEVFRNINSIISMDLFTILYMIKNNIVDFRELDGYYSDISLADSQLDDLLVKGVAENHLHANSGFNFILLWEQLMNQRIKAKNIKKVKYFKNGEGEFKENPHRYFILAAIYRNIVMFYMKYQNDSDITIEEYCKGELKNIKNILLVVSGQEKEITNIELLKLLEDLNKQYQIKDNDKKEDIVFRIFTECKGINTYGENVFLMKAFTKYEETKEPFLFKILLKYIRIKNEFYQQVVQSSTIKGLDNFSNFFDRATKFLGSSGLSDEAYYELLFRTLFQNEYLKRLELRFSISKNESDFKKNLLSILSAYKKVIDDEYSTNEDSNVDFPRIGLVFHLIKRKDEDGDEKCWLAFDGKSNPSEISFKKIQEDYDVLIQNLLNLRNESPYLSYFILGIDAANLENNTPVQVFAPIYKRARDSSIDSLIKQGKDGSSVRYKSLCYTFHAGEEFRHILSGLRRIHEVVTFCKFHSGDRIGHAIALGIDPNKWVNANTVVILPRGEYLDNLLWVWGVYTNSISKNVAVNLFLEREIYSLAKDIFKNMNGINIPMLYEAYQLRFNKFQKNENYKKSAENLIENNNEVLCVKIEKHQSSIWNAEKITHAYNCKCYLDKISEPIYVQSNNIQKEIINEVKRELVNELSTKGIVVEINPSSNTSIGELDAVFDSQAYNINNVEGFEENNVLININSDNPLIFNTNISNEYAYMYYGMLNKGFGKEKALEWIEKLRKSGMETSFIDNKLSNTQYYQYLCEVLNKYSK